MHKSITEPQRGYLLGGGRFREGLYVRNGEIADGYTVRNMGSHAAKIEIERLIDALPIADCSRQELIGRVARMLDARDGSHDHAVLMNASKETLAGMLQGQNDDGINVDNPCEACGTKRISANVMSHQVGDGQTLMLCGRCRMEYDDGQRKDRERPKAEPEPKAEQMIETKHEPDATTTDDLARTIATALASFKPGLDETAVTEVFRREGNAIIESVNERVNERLETIGLPTVLELQIGDAPKIEIGLAHKQLPDLITMMTAGLNVVMIGGAGSGKTHAAEQASKALEREFSADSVCQQTTKSDLLGFIHAGGDVVKTKLRNRVENGGYHLLDEIDNGNANVLNVTNAITANSIVSFPDAMVRKHETFGMLAAGNTRMDGADHVYVGRIALDGALKNRFVPLIWETDWALVNALYADCPDWTARVRLLYSALESIPVSTRPNVLITPRQVDQGARLLRAGWDVEKVERVVIWNHFAANDAAQLRSAAK